MEDTFSVTQALVAVDARICALELCVSNDVGTSLRTAADGDAPSPTATAEDAEAAEAVSAAAAKISRDKVWVAEDDAKAANAANAADAAARLRRPLQERLNGIIAGVASAPCAQALRDVNRLLRQLRSAIDTVGVEAGTAVVSSAAVEADIELMTQMVPEARRFRDATRHLRTLEARMHDPRVLLWATRVATADGSTTAPTPLHDIPAAVEAMAGTPLDGAKAVYVDPKEIAAIMSNAERAVRLLERYSAVQAKQIRFSAYAGEVLAQYHRTLAAREARVDAFIDKHEWERI
jgi:hypothetical protein